MTVMVLLRLHPYCQLSLKRTWHSKLSTRLYGPFRIVHKFREVAYELKIPKVTLLHYTFHVSSLKPFHGSLDKVECTIPPIIDGLPSLSLQAILESCVRGGCTEALVYWIGFSPAEASCEIQLRYPHFKLADKHVLQDGENDTSSFRLKFCFGKIYH